MCRVLKEKGRFKILKTNKDYVIVNTELEYKNHAHIKRIDHAKQLIKLIDKGIKPKSHYMQVAAERLLGDGYSELQEKKKEYYINIGKRVR